MILSVHASSTALQYDLRARAMLGILSLSLPGRISSGLSDPCTLHREYLHHGIRRIRGEGGMGHDLAEACILRWGGGREAFSRQCVYKLMLVQL